MNTETSRQERRRQATRQKLIAAAREQIAARGYAATGVMDITEAADLSKGTFYLYFNDKDDLLHALIREGFEDLRAEMDRALTDENPVEHVAEALRAVFHYAAANRDVFRIMLGKEAPADLSLMAINYFAGAVEDIIAAVGINPIERPFLPTALAQFVAGACVRLALWWLEDDHGLTPDEISAITYRLLSQGIFNFLTPPTTG
ncbi:MAG TPA: TetR/AcrR family transcriptional regulator [Phototrophicaceae bacterium]|nr:TetR/AcrR family transcriptional regulator [Phototrophicaceae bacterium]